MSKEGNSMSFEQATEFAEQWWNSDSVDGTLLNKTIEMISLSNIPAVTALLQSHVPAGEPIIITNQMAHYAFSTGTLDMIFLILGYMLRKMTDASDVYISKDDMVIFQRDNSNKGVREFVEFEMGRIEQSVDGLDLFYNWKDIPFCDELIENAKNGTSFLFCKKHLGYYF